MPVSEISRWRFAPIYYRIQEGFRPRITAGEPVPGNRLPSRTELAATSNTIRSTVRHALSLLVAVTRANQIWRLPLHADGTTTKVGAFITLSGGLAGPDGLAIDEAGNLAIAHCGLGTVWLFSALGEPMLRVRAPAGLSTTNVAYGGPEGRSLFIIESDSGSILRAELPVPGRAMFSHM